MDLELKLKSTILEALLEKITKVQNNKTNNAAIEAFTKIITAEPESAKSAVLLITTKIQSPNEWEALQALHLLDVCMQMSHVVQIEIGKFRFLNELIKLVSPKYLGNSTPAAIKQRIISLLKLWSDKYSKETKIKEAFLMLIKQGVVLDEKSKYDCQNVLPTISVSSIARPHLYEEDEEKSRLLQKLLRSNKPSDLKAANHLIKTMVKEKEEKEDLRLISNNVKLLSEMLLNASSGTSSEDIELMKELKETCVNMKPHVAYSISSCNKNAKDAAELFELNDLLNDTLQLYQATMASIKKPVDTNHEKQLVSDRCATSSLLDFSSPVDDVPILSASINSGASNADLLSDLKDKNDVNTLEEIFNSAYSVVDAPKTVENALNSNCSSSTSAKLFQDLNALGKSLLECKEEETEATNDDAKLNESIFRSFENVCISRESVTHSDLLLSDDDELLINGNDEETSVCDTWPNSQIPCKFIESTITTSVQSEQLIVEPLSDVYVPLVEIKTDNNEKIPAFEDPSGINVSIQLANNKPRCDISVFLVLSCSKKNESVSNFLFQPVVPKECRLKLQPPSKCDLPPFNPHIPVETIVQVMLIASSKKDYIPLKFVISYNEKDEMITEMGEVSILPLL